MYGTKSPTIDGLTTFGFLQNLKHFSQLDIATNYYFSYVIHYYKLLLKATQVYNKYN